MMFCWLAVWASVPAVRLRGQRGPAIGMAFLTDTAIVRRAERMDVAAG